MNILSILIFDIFCFIFHFHVWDTPPTFLCMGHITLLFMHETHPTTFLLWDTHITFHVWDTSSQFSRLRHVTLLSICWTLPLLPKYRTQNPTFHVWDTSHYFPCVEGMLGMDCFHFFKIDHFVLNTTKKYEKRNDCF